MGKVVRQNNKTYEYPKIQETEIETSENYKYKKWKV